MRNQHRFACACILFLTLTKTTFASFVIESEPAYDPYRDGPRQQSNTLYAQSDPYRYRYQQERRPHYTYRRRTHHVFHPYASRIPSHINTGGEKTIVVNPEVHTWGAYSAKGDLVRAGLISAGSNYCPDLHRPCRTKSGTFRIQTLGSANCVSKKFPLGRGGAPMPYCMYFNGAMALHGSYELAEANLSHGCVRMSVGDAKWIRFNFAHVGTKVIVKPY